MLMTVVSPISWLPRRFSRSGPRCRPVSSSLRRPRSPVRHRHRGLAWLREAGGVRPRRGRDLKGRCLSFAEREEIALGRAGGEKIRVIATRLGRSPWDQGPEMLEWKQVSVDADIDIYFCDPHAPWQRATNERVIVKCCG
jgi:hypothetical protein